MLPLPKFTQWYQAQVGMAVVFLSPLGIIPGDTNKTWNLQPGDCADRAWRNEMFSAVDLSREFLASDQL